MPGDDFDDDYTPDDVVAGSGDEIDGPFIPLEGEEDVIAASEGVSNGGAPTMQAQESAKKAKKRKQQRTKNNERKAKKQRLTLHDPAEPRNAALTASQPPSVLSELLVRGQTQVFKGISQLELDDMRIPESCIIDTQSWKEERSHTTFGDFIRQGGWDFLPARTAYIALCNFQVKNAVTPTLATRIAQSSKNNGAPTCIILAGNALRVLDLIKPIKTLTSDKSGEVAKLFARHFKLSDHEAHLKNTKVGVAVGTPNRVYALLTETDSLKLTALTHIILDVTFIDIKMRSMLDMLETKTDIFKFLGHEPIRKRLVEGKTSLIFF